jgi:hypothetical protein
MAATDSAERRCRAGRVFVTTANEKKPGILKMPSFLFETE